MTTSMAGGNIVVDREMTATEIEHFRRKLGESPDVFKYRFWQRVNGRGGERIVTPQNLATAGNRLQLGAMEQERQMRMAEHRAKADNYARETWVTALESPFRTFGEVYPIDPVVPEPPTPAMPQPTNAESIQGRPEPRAAEDVLAENISLLEQLGASPAVPKKKLVMQSIYSVLQREEILVYNFAEVEAFMGALAKKRNKFFCWCPLVGKDPKKRGLYDRYANSNGEIKKDRYDQPIPNPVLQTCIRAQGAVQSIDKDLEVEFFASDYAAPAPDPFMAMRVKGVDMPMLVIAHWDEPAFRPGITKEKK